MTFGALSNAASPVSLHGPGAELEGVFKHPRPGASGAEHRPGACQTIQFYHFGTGRCRHAKKGG